jgi:hypothetical protein
VRFSTTRVRSFREWTRLARKAVVASGEVLKDSGAKFWDGQEWRMWVTDEAGTTVRALRFSAE